MISSYVSKGGVGSSAKVSLTAYVLMALLESDPNHVSEQVIKKAVRCLVKPRNDTNLYSTILTAYTLQLVKQQDNFEICLKASGKIRKDFLRKVAERAVQSADGEFYWKNDGLHHNTEVRHTF
jgi:hypothetical protein